VTKEEAPSDWTQGADGLNCTWSEIPQQTSDSSTIVNVTNFRLAQPEMTLSSSHPSGTVKTGQGESSFLAFSLENDRAVLSPFRRKKRVEIAPASPGITAKSAIAH
jgi:hypothetical protein